MPTGLVWAQAGPPLGSDFILFRNGANQSIPVVGGTEEADPADPSEVSLRYDYGEFAYLAFSWQPDVGVDMSGNLAGSDILHLRLKVDPANAGQDSTFLMLEDKSSGQPDDLPMRLVWQIPDSLKDGAWHALDIPLPPETCANLASARGTLGLADHWWYSGSWSDSTQRVGDYDDLCGATTNNPMYWKEFEWSNVRSLGVFWDHASGGGSIWVDDVYIGQQGLNLFPADEVPPSMTGVTATALPHGNEIAWSHIEDVGAYKVYGSSNYFTDITADGVFDMGRIVATGIDTSLTHYLQHVHPMYAPSGSHAFMHNPYYAVTSLSQYGIENKDIGASLVDPLNLSLATGPVVLQLTDAEADMLRSDFSAGNVSGAAFDDGWLPFKINQDRYNVVDTPEHPESDDDLSGTFWVGYTQENELWLYAEIRDEEVVLPTTGEPERWTYDIIEIGWTNYDVRDDGGDVIFGTPHQEFRRGEYADYQFHLGGQDGGASAFVSVDTPWRGEVAGGALYSEWKDASDVQIGYKILAYIPLDAIQSVSDGDVVVDPPAAGSDPRIVAMIIVVNDRDNGVRQSQVLTSLKYNADGNWWNTPAQWETVSMAPRTSYPIATEAEVPARVTLAPNYPNPFNPQTTIAFELASTEQVTLTVHDVTGRNVSTLLRNQIMYAGHHTARFDAQGFASGIYIYYLSTGAGFRQARRMVLIR